MPFQDDDLTHFDTVGPDPLPTTMTSDYVTHDGAKIWYATHGQGPAVVLLHGGMGHSGNWGYQVPALLAAGYQTVVIDSRGHGRSTRDDKPYTYERMADDVLAVMDKLRIAKAAFIGWSDGACTSLILGAKNPDRVTGVFFFACNMDPTGTKPFEFTPMIGRCLSRHKKDYAALSPTPDDFDSFAESLGHMQRTEPNYSKNQLAAIDMPVTVVLGEHDEFIKPEHAEYLAKSIPNAALIRLPNVSHFAPLQKPNEFNQVVLEFLKRSAY